MRAVRARIVALLAALLLLLPSGASAHAAFYCQMMGRVMASCCCENAEAAQASASAPEVQVADCCSRITAGTRSASLGAQHALDSVAAPALLRTVAEPLPLGQLASAAGTCTASTQAPLAIGPPLFVVHCARLN